MGEHERIDPPDFLLPQERCQDGFARVERLTEKSPAVDDHDVRTGELDHRGVPLPDVQKRDAQPGPKIPLCDPIPAVDENGADEADEQRLSQRRRGDARKEEQRYAEAVEQGDFEGCGSDDVRRRIRKRRKGFHEPDHCLNDAAGQLHEHCRGPDVHGQQRDRD